MKRVPAHTVFAVVGPFGSTPFVLTSQGRLMAMLDTTARDPDGRDDAAFAQTTQTLENALAALPADAQVQQWLWHGPAVLPTVKPRQLRTAQRIGETRLAHLSKRPLYQTRLLTAISIDTKALAGKTNWIDLMIALLSAAVDKNARRDLARSFHIGSQLKFLRVAVEQCAERLRDAAAQFSARLSIHQDHRLLDAQEAWQWCRALAQVDARAFMSSSAPPRSHWYASLASGEIDLVRACGADMLRCSGAGTYLRTGSITRLHEQTSPGFWAAGTKPIIGVEGCFVLCMNATPLSPIKSAMQFKLAQNQIDQAKLSIAELLMQAAGKKPEKKEDDPLLTNQQKELAAAQSESQRWWHVNCYATAFGTEPQQVADTSLALDTALANANVGVTWETAIAIDAFAAMQPGMPALTPRAHLLNSTQVGALALSWSHGQGDATVADLQGEEPLTYLETRDRQLFGFNPFVGEKSTVICVGPTRSGKTFAMNALLAHFPKYDHSHLVAIDFDPGSECLATLYGDDAALVRGGHGLNPFAAQGPGFVAHFTRLAMAIISTNDDPTLANLADGDQLAMDSALHAVLALPKSMQCLSTFVLHLPLHMRPKFSRWVRDGDARYADLLDVSEERVGLIERAVTVFNLTALADDPKALLPVLLELLYRTTTCFEDPARRGYPKAMKLDEVHKLLKHPIFARYLEDKTRTIAKWLGSFWLLTQQPHELLAIPNWPAIRTAASTYIFTAAPELDRAAYREVFGLTPADLQTIERLVPKSEIYLVQPETGVRKVLRLDPDPATQIWASSTARVVAEREQRDALTNATLLTEGATT